jgi:hypothetical protein
MPAKAGIQPGDDKRGLAILTSRQRHRMGLIVALASCREEWNNAGHAKPVE